MPENGPYAAEIEALSRAALTPWPPKGEGDRMTVIEQSVTIRRCGTCGIFEPQKLGYLSKIVAHPCAHRDWREVEYVPAATVRGAVDLIREALVNSSAQAHLSPEWRERALAYVVPPPAGGQ